MTDQQLRAAISFAVLMASDDGVMSKSPQYIAEKFIAASNGVAPDLDSRNGETFDQYLASWGIAQH